MTALVRELVSEVRNRGGLSRSLREFGIISFFDYGLRELSWRSSGALVRRRPEDAWRQYGWLEAILMPAYDYWYRYATAIRCLPASGRSLRLLEVASGRGGGIAHVLQRKHLRVCLVDYSRELLAVRNHRSAWRVCADGSRLPFPEASFDIVVSTDTLEHISDKSRGRFLEELKRVTRDTVVLTCPLESCDGTMQARRYDRALFEYLRENHCRIPNWLAEHLQTTYPVKEDLAAAFPGSEIKGSQNGDCWLRFHRVYRRSLLWCGAGFYYRLFLKPADAQPPYYRGTLVWRKIEAK
jgi:ubiquinone/menaquinone biosynthesis C-methylase UbiE